ncbi:MAG: D-cysteine desulfhydrase family protein [Bacteriovoracaceae bacterium]|jgi:D-cysteine desulfhydrase|nr:D-cysteine desulfhydrase family protein [Bacteriovoracaceae bacterium]
MTFDLADEKPLDLFMGPTPIQKLGALSKQFNKEIFVKRDDRTGFVFSGNKIRKLSYLLKDALNKNCNIIITCGGIQSNHARATAYAARELGLDSCLLLRGTELELYKGNFLLNKLVGADIKYITHEDWANNYSRMEEISLEFKERGLRPYIIPEGGSNHVGALGYVQCFKEIIEQTSGIISDIFSATGSGGTTAGLLLGEELISKNDHTKIHTINICDDEAHFQKRINSIVEDFIQHYQLKNCRVNKAIIHDGYVGPGYAENTLEGLKKIHNYCRESGILLDPVYTGKAFFGMIAELEKNPQNFGDRILFIHTGGGFANFSFEHEFSAII